MIYYTSPIPTPLGPKLKWPASRNHNRKKWGFGCLKWKQGSNMVNSDSNTIFLIQIVLTLSLSYFSIYVWPLHIIAVWILCRIQLQKLYENAKNALPAPKKWQDIINCTQAKVDIKCLTISMPFNYITSNNYNYDEHFMPFTFVLLWTFLYCMMTNMVC